MASSTLRDRLFSYSADLGISAIGVSPTKPTGGMLKRHLKWLDRGFQGDMAYLERLPEARYDARSLMPGCESVIVIAQSYYQGANSVGGEVGKISMYALGDDYHEVLRDKLLALSRFLDGQVPNHRSKAVVDHSPLTEKAFALSAGIGWEGRHSLVLNHEFGSYFFLGMLLTNAVLPLSDTYAGDCGTCSQCIQACPTAALLGPGILDARKCISYLTTERKEAVSPGEQLHGWLYGCDDCQAACPHNQALPDSKELRFAPRPTVIHMDAMDILCLGEAAFSNSFSGSVIKRRRLARLQAQAVAVLTQRKPASSPAAEEICTGDKMEQ